MESKKKSRVDGLWSVVCHKKFPITFCFLLYALCFSNKKSTVDGRWPHVHLKRISIAFYLMLCTLYFSNCSSRHQSANNGSSIKFEQYYLQGEQLYQGHCSNCHQKNGSGLGLVYPPLDTSDFMENHFEEVICLMDNGRKGELLVNGKNFNKSMPGIPSLTDLEIAEIATYIYNTWNHKRDLIDVKEVSSILSNCTEDKN